MTSLDDPHASARHWPEAGNDTTRDPAWVALAFRQPPGTSVPVTVKRWRTAPRAADPASGAAAGDSTPSQDADAHRRPRTFTIARPATAGDALPATPEAAAAAVMDTDMPAPGAAWRRRRRKDPDHAPGAVTRIVFEPPPAAGEPTGSAARHLLAIGPEFEPDPGYGRVMGALQRVRETVRLALAARAFRID